MMHWFEYSILHALTIKKLQFLPQFLLLKHCRHQNIPAATYIHISITTIIILRDNQGKKMNFAFSDQK